MKKATSFFVCLFFVACALAQTVTLRFTGRLTDGSYKQLEWVKVENVTRSWTEYVMFPDTVLELTNNATTFIDDPSLMAMDAECTPNPFSGTTMVRLRMPVDDDAAVQVLSLNGRTVLEQHVPLKAGENLLEVTLAERQMYVMCVTTSFGRKALKLVNVGTSAANRIRFCGTVPLPLEKVQSNRPFAFGDSLIISGATTMHGVQYGSIPVVQRQYVSEDFTLVFSMQSFALFSLSRDGRATFSCGNLQWSATGGGTTPTTHPMIDGTMGEGTWRFADEQWRYVGYGNHDVDTHYTGWIDLFAWGTSGCDITNRLNLYSLHTSPYSIVANNGGALYGPTGGAANLDGNEAHFDWGVNNGILNPTTMTTDPPGLWRALSMKEWKYLLKQRRTNTVAGGTSNARFTLAYIDTNSSHGGTFDANTSTFGLIVFPDKAGTLTMRGTGRWGSVNGYGVATNCSYSDWRYLEDRGCAFLPAAGFRYVRDVNAYGSAGYYWSTTHGNVLFQRDAYMIGFNLADSLLISCCHRMYGLSVRLVREYINYDLPDVRIETYTETLDSATVCCAAVIGSGIDSVTERGFCWDTAPYPDLSNNYIVVGSDTGSFCDTIFGLEPGRLYYVRAYAKNSEGTGYSTQIFFLLPPPPESATFSVAQYSRVYFSPGNLQWSATGGGATPVTHRTAGGGTAPGRWRFAPQQWCSVGAAPGNNTSDTALRRTQRYWIDLFGWATSGYHNPLDTNNLFYQPYDINSLYRYIQGIGSFYCYGPSPNMPDQNLVGTSANYDWGVYNEIYNPRTNSTDSAGVWRTLSADEWRYLMDTRQTNTTVNGVSDARYAYVKVDTNSRNTLYYNDNTAVVALIIFPDSADTLIMYGDGYWGQVNTIAPVPSARESRCTYADWKLLEAKGCVLLPLGGRRIRPTVYQAGSCGYYHTRDYRQSFYFNFSVYGMNMTHGTQEQEIMNGQSVRLVRDLITLRPVVETKLVSRISDTSALCSGYVVHSGEDSVVERGLCWDTAPNPDTNRNRVVCGSNIGTYQATITGLSPATVYYVRAYAINSHGIAYGANQRFVTCAVPASPRFSVSNSHSVRMARGNLQWSATGGTNSATVHTARNGVSQPGSWRFAPEQWRIIGAANGNIDTNYSGWIDLFGWGTSGYHNSGDTCNAHYQPYATSVASVNATYNMYGYGPSAFMADASLTGTSENYDWGMFNPISDVRSGTTDTAGTWRTLSQTEWDYLLNTRTTATTVSGTPARFVAALIDTNVNDGYHYDSVNAVQGIILFPDSTGAITMFGDGVWGSVNGGNAVTTCSYLDWKAMEYAGCVFLPNTGSRDGNMFGSNGMGCYWASTYETVGTAYLTLFVGTRVVMSSFLRYSGAAVRLASDY